MSSSSEQKLLKQFGANVAAIRKSKGITQERLAETVGMSVVAIAYIETGKRWVRLATLDKIAKALKTDTADFFKSL